MISADADVAEKANDVKQHKQKLTVQESINQNLFFTIKSYLQNLLTNI